MVHLTWIWLKISIPLWIWSWGVNKLSQNLEAHIEELEFITIDDPIYLRDRDRLRLINKQAAKLEKDKRDIKWRVRTKNIIEYVKYNTVSFHWYLF